MFTLFNVCLSLCLSYSLMATNSRKARLHLFSSNHTHGGCQPSLADSCYIHDLFIEWWITKISNFCIQGCCCQCSRWGSKAVNTQFGKKKPETELKFWRRDWGTQDLLDHSFPNIETVCCSMSSSNCCFLTCIQFSQKAGKVVWYSRGPLFCLPYVSFIFVTCLSVSLVISSLLASR